MPVDHSSQRCPAPAPGASWRVVGTSVRGASHEKDGLPCQDAQASRLIDPDWVALAVADGAGSAAHSELGARAAVARAVDVLSERVHGHLARESPVSDEAGWRAAPRP
jgi:hypothetical protein